MRSHYKSVEVVEAHDLGQRTAIVKAGPFRTFVAATDRARRISDSFIIHEPETTQTYEHWYVVSGRRS